MPDRRQHWHREHVPPPDYPREPETDTPADYFAALDRHAEEHPEDFVPIRFDDLVGGGDE